LQAGWDIHVCAVPGVVVTQNHISVINPLLPAQGALADVSRFSPELVGSLTAAQLEAAARQYLQALGLNSNMPVMVASQLQVQQLTMPLQQAVAAVAATATAAEAARAAAAAAEAAQDARAAADHAHNQAHNELSQCVLQHVMAANGTLCSHAKDCAASTIPLPGKPPMVVFNAELPTGMLYAVDCQPVTLQQADAAVQLQGQDTAGAQDGQVAVLWHYLRAPRSAPNPTQPAALRPVQVEVSCSINHACFMDTMLVDCEHAASCNAVVHSQVHDKRCIATKGCASKHIHQE
jgi:ribosomal protein L12E/L44/L45/RPP1/RPP2